MSKPRAHHSVARITPEANRALRSDEAADRQMNDALESDIELAQKQDCAAVSACVHAAYFHYLARLGREPAPMLADYAALIARGLVYVLREPAAREVCGVLVIEPRNDGMFIENVAVRPEHQHNGFGRRLLLFAEEQALSKGLNVMRLYTHELMTENIRYYRRLGYEEIDRRTEHGYRRVFMRKLLERG
jgi:ribosomal protein S18 acetylase RimI-like enzyme